MKKPTLETGLLAAFAILSVTALLAIIIVMIASIRNDKKNTPTIESDPILVEIDCGVSYHRIFYDKETGVMYIENTSHGGVSPMYNADGTLKVYKNRTY
jgi:hypothetical protein